MARTGGEQVLEKGTWAFRADVGRGATIPDTECVEVEGI